MFKIFVTIICCLLSFEVKAQNPQTLDQINADLLAKKAASEPFKDSDVKVDLESLGLDKIDPKNNETETTEKKDNNNSPNVLKSAEKTDSLKTSELPDLKKEKVEKSLLVDAPNQKSNTISKTVTLEDKLKDLQKKDVEQNENTFYKIQNFIKKSVEKQKIEKFEVKVSQDPKEQEQSAIKKDLDNSVKKVENLTNLEKKNNLKNQLLAKKKIKENERKQKESLEKLNELRKKYLLKIGSEKTSSNQNYDEDFSDSEQKIIPQRKEINKFVSYEAPALPILNRYRSKDNEGIPIIISNREKADILFRAIGSKNISYFNSAYNQNEDPNMRNFAGDTILTYALLLQKYEVVASILAKGANPNLANALGYTPMQIAIELKDFKALEVLVNNNADINATDGYGRTYLMHAARVGFISGMDLLIKKEVNLNAMDHDGFTALGIANQYKQGLAISLLLKNGAKPWVEKPYDPNSESLIKQLENKWKR